MNKKIKYLLAGVIAMFSSYCAQDNGQNEINITQLKESIKNDSSLVILDVRTQQELEGPLGKIDGIINIPLQELKNRINELEKYKNKNIAVICRSGKRSAKAKSILLEKGYKVKNVVGGMMQFRAE